MKTFTIYHVPGHKVGATGDWKKRAKYNFKTYKVEPHIIEQLELFDTPENWQIIGDLEHEEFWVLFLNNANKVIAKSQISKGGLTATIVDVRLVFKRALEIASVGIIVCHNHPSGKLQPSNADKQLTQKIKEAGITLDIKLLDHLIITEKAYFSFADEGLL